MPRVQPFGGQESTVRLFSRLAESELVFYGWHSAIPTLEGKMDWLGVATTIKGQIEANGEAFIPWSTVQHAAGTVHRSPISLQLAKTLDEDLSPMGMLKRLARKVGNLELAVDKTGDMVHLKQPEPRQCPVLGMPSSAAPSLSPHANHVLDRNPAGLVPGPGMD